MLLKRINILTFLLYLRDPNYGSNHTMWPHFEKQNQYYLNINSSKPAASNILIGDWIRRYKFWYELLPNQVYEQCHSEKPIFDRLIRSSENSSSGNTANNAFTRIQLLITYACFLGFYQFYNLFLFFREQNYSFVSFIFF